MGTNKYADIDVAIHSIAQDKRSAATLATRLDEQDAEITIWHNRYKWYAPVSRRALKAKLEQSQLTIVLWSKASCEKKEQLLWPEIIDLHNLNKVVSVRIEDCIPPMPFGSFQTYNFFATGHSSLNAEFWRICEQIMLRLGRETHANIAGYRLKALEGEPSGQIRTRARQQFSFRELDGIRKSLQDKVDAYSPDVIFSFDARGGIWAQIFSENMPKPARVAGGFRLRSKGPRKNTLLFEKCHTIKTDRWHLMVPPTLLNLSRNKRLLFVDDYTQTGSTCYLFQQFMIDRVGFPAENVKTLALVSSPIAKEKGQDPDYFGIRTDADTVDMFYMLRR